MTSSSRPPTPAYYGSRGDNDFRFKLYGAPSEGPENYRPGGYHPVVLGDVLNDRYEIIGKLGYGSFSTVWLVTDHQSVAPALKCLHYSILLTGSARTSMHL